MSTKESMRRWLLVPALSLRLAASVAGPGLGEGGPVKELRVGLVCYGGVSLAVYMSGITQEIHRLVRASQAFAADPEHNPFAADATESIYWQALRDKRGREQGVATRVVVEAIAGTSAGGINGVLLAKALAHDLTQDGVGPFWFRVADLNWLTGSRTRTGAYLKSAWRLFRNRPLFDSRPMLTSFLGLLDAMDRQPAQGQAGSLVPPGHGLDLFITTTDVQGSRRTLELPDRVCAGITQVEERTHPQMFHFTFSRPDGAVASAAGDPFGPAGNPLLAFAARATSSFPIAFPAVRMDDLTRAVPPERLATGWQDQLLPNYRAEHADPGAATLVDGAVCLNGPFSPVIDTLLGRPAAVEASRVIIYIEPDPAAALAAATQGPPPGDLRMLVNSMVSIPGTQSILAELDRVAAYNQRAVLMNDILDGIEAEATRFARENRSHDRQDGDAMGERRWSGPAQEVYLRVRTEAVLEQFAAVLTQALGAAPGSNPARRVRQGVRAWAERQRLTGPDPDPAGQSRLRHRFDLGFSFRRLQMLGRFLNRMYAGAGDRAPLDTLRSRLQDQADQILAVIQGRDLPPGLLSGLAQDLAATPGDSQAETVIAARGARMDALAATLGDHLKIRMDGWYRELMETLEQGTRGWQPRDRDRLFAAVAGFPVLDAAVYPIQRLAAEAGEMDPLGVFRISPVDAARLGRQGDQRLAGAGLDHFRGFLKLEYRENDFLWGRLDGVDRLLTLLGAPTGPLGTAGFRAVLAAERPRLTHLRPELWQSIEAAIQAQADR
jgi:patatin-related protein